MDTSQPADSVMSASQFFSSTVLSHLSRRKLADMLAARTHWMFVMPPHEIATGYRLIKLHEERCGTHIECLLVPALGFLTMVYAFPKAYLSLDEVMNEVLEPNGFSHEAVESAGWLVLGGNDALAEAVSRWASIDPLLN
jgi:hypothetical protein